MTQACGSPYEASQRDATSSQDREGCDDTRTGEELIFAQFFSCFFRPRTRNVQIEVSRLISSPTRAEEVAGARPHAVRQFGRMAIIPGDFPRDRRRSIVPNDGAGVGLASPTCDAPRMCITRSPAVRRKSAMIRRWQRHQRLRAHDYAVVPVARGPERASPEAKGCRQRIVA
jgi:hypothetical protein